VAPSRCDAPTLVRVRVRVRVRISPNPNLNPNPSPNRSPNPIPGTVEVRCADALQLAGAAGGALAATSIDLVR
jgi:hypothetical protein